jgi:hypothetical protein
MPARKKLDVPVTPPELAALRKLRQRANNGGRIPDATAQMDKLAKLAHDKELRRGLKGEVAIHPEGMLRKFTELQLTAIKLWAHGESKYSAALKAGYQDGGETFYRISKYPETIAIYDREKALFEAACQMTRKRVMDGLLEGIEMAKLAGEPSSMIAGWREIGKMCGYYEPVKRTLDITVNGSVLVKQLERKTDAELLEMIKGAASAETVAFIEDFDAQSDE